MATLKSHLLVALLFLLVATTARADRFNKGDNSFAELVEKIARECKTFDQCASNPLLSRIVYDHEVNGKADISPAMLKHLQRVAIEQANIWADTILEGDFHADGNTRLDLVESLVLNGKVAGYRITYSERAWFIGNCAFDYENDTSLAGCTPGRIQESSFVSADGKVWFRDLDAMADFDSERTLRKRALTGEVSRSPRRARR